MNMSPASQNGISFQGILLFLALPAIVTVLAFASLLTTDVSEMAIGTPLVVRATETAAATAKPSPTAVDLETLYAAGLTAYQAGDFSAAEMAFREVLLGAPDSAVVHNSLGMALAQQGRLEEAAQEYAAATALDAGYATAWFNLGVVRLALADPAGAEGALLQAAAVDGDFAAAHLKLADLYVEQGRNSEAEARYLQAIRAGPELVEAHLGLGLLYASQEDWSKAQNALETGLALAPDSLEIRYHLGVVAVNRGDTRDALLLFNSVIADDPGGEWGSLAADALSMLQGDEDDG